jgi:hypothetical protein
VTLSPQCRVAGGLGRSAPPRSRDAIRPIRLSRPQRRLPGSRRPGRDHLPLRRPRPRRPPGGLHHRPGERELDRDPARAGPRTAGADGAAVRHPRAARPIAARAAGKRERLAAAQRAEALAGLENVRIDAERRRAEIEAGLGAQILLAVAARERAGQIGKVEHLPITPELLSPIIERLGVAGRKPEMVPRCVVVEHPDRISGAARASRDPRAGPLLPVPTRSIAAERRAAPSRAPGPPHACAWRGSAAAAAGEHRASRPRSFPVRARRRGRRPR